MKSANRKCWRMLDGGYCRRPRSEHMGDPLFRPNGSGNTFREKNRGTPAARKALSASNSFNLEQARVLAAVLEGVRTARDLRAFQRANRAALLCIERKALRMIATIHRLAAEQQGQQNAVPTTEETATP